MKFIVFQEKETFENEELIQQKWISRARSCKLKDWRCNKPKNIVGGYFREMLKSRETATCIAKFRKKMKRMVEKRSYFWADLGLWCNERRYTFRDFSRPKSSEEAREMRGSQLLRYPNIPAWFSQEPFFFVSDHAIKILFLFY